MAVAQRVTALKAELSEPLFRNAYALMLNTVVNSVLGAAYWVLAARRYDASQVGRDNALISLVILVSTLTQMNFGQALIRFLPKSGLKTQRFILNSYAVSSVAALIGALAVTCFCHFGLTSGSSLFMSTQFAFWFVLATIAWSIFNLQDAALTGLRSAIWIPLENGIFGLAKLVLLAALAGTSVDHQLFLSWNGPLLIFLVAVNWLIFDKIVGRHAERTSHHEDVPTASQLTRYMAGDYVGQVFTQLSATLLPVLVVGLLNREQGAYLVPAQTVWLAMNMLSVAITSSLLVEAVADPSRAHVVATAMLRRICIIVLPSAALAAVAAPWLLQIFGGEYRSNATHLLQLFMLSTFPRVVVSLYGTIARLRKQTGRFAVVLALQAAMLVGGTLLFAGSYGLDAVGWSAFASQLLPAVVLAPSVFRWLRPKPAMLSGATVLTQ